MDQFFHTTFGFCIWDAAALLVVFAIVLVLVVHVVRSNKREEEMRSELSDRMARDAVPTDEDTLL